jgi:hypothetical protein
LLPENFQSSVYIDVALLSACNTYIRYLIYTSIYHDFFRNYRCILQCRGEKDVLAVCGNGGPSIDSEQPTERDGCMFRVHPKASASLCKDDIILCRSLGGNSLSPSILLKFRGPRWALSKGGGNDKKRPFLRRAGGSIRPRLGTRETREP